MVLVPWPISVERGQDADRPSPVSSTEDDARELDLAAAREARAVPGQREADAASADGAARRTGAPRRARRAAVAGALELGRLGGTLQDLLAGHALAQHLPGRRRVARADRPSAGAARAGDMPSASATRLACISAANSVWGAPKPRNAPLGGVLVAVARPRMRTSGTGTGRPRGARPATARPGSGCSTRRRP